MKYGDYHCECCRHEFSHKYAPAGDSVVCPKCKAEGYVTYGYHGEVEMVWYEDDE